MPYTLLVNTLPLLGEETGVGTYTRNIAQALREDSRFDATFYYGVFAKDLPSRGSSPRDRALSALKDQIKKIPILRTLGKKTLVALRRLRALGRKTHFTCYFEPNFLLLNDISAEKTVLTVHDFSCFRYPHWHPKERVDCMERYFPESLRRADHIVTVSEAIRAEAANYGIAQERITAIPNGYDPTIFHEGARADLSGYGLPDTFVLFAGTLEPRKNLATLLAAHRALGGALRKRYPLVVAGGYGWKNADLLAQLTGEPDCVKLLGYVPTQDLAALYTRATVLCYPSWYEGFGLPIIEAMACACPVITSKDPALVETGGDAALYVAPDDVEGMARALRELLENPEQRAILSEKGLLRAQTFSWQKSAQAHINLFLTLCTHKP
ncbi:MAG: glycosyltransferase family 4 protein [Desulfovibrionaceae bacterium]|nr:glycosyltransferase family 4 protein [Desulfovibrionaceae bacterium]